MVLEKLRDGAQWQLSVLNDEPAKKLIFILCLPLLDGVFATLLVTGAVQTFSDMISVSITIFSGAGALAILYSCSDTRKQAQRIVLKSVPPLIVGALMVALVAPIYEQLFYVERLQYAAGLVLLVIAGQLADIGLADKFSTPAVILTGLVLSSKGFMVPSLSLSYVVPALLTAVIALAALYLATFLTSRNLDMFYIRRGSSVVLLIISLSLFGVPVPSELGLAVFAASLMAAL